MLQTAGEACVRVLRDARWLNADRVRVYTRLLFAAVLIAILAWVGLSRGGLDRQGKPLGTDFLSFWAASRLALSGHPALVYDVATHVAAQRAVSGAAAVGYAAFFYPPLYLLVCLPLGLAPYLVALAAWLLATGAACWRVVRGILGEAGAGLTVAMLAFPGVLVTLGHGQNAFLTTALFGLGFLVADRRPLLAGAMLGLLAFKPQLGLLIPVALIAGGRWKAAVGAAAAVAAFAAASAAVFGLQTWRAFLGIASEARAAMERGSMGLEKMQSLFAAARLWRVDTSFAYGLQAAAAIAMVAVVVAVARRRTAPGGGLALGAVTANATLLASPFLLDYDLMLLAIPIAWMVREARRTGFRPWEKTALFAAFVLPLVSRTVAMRLGVPLGPPVDAALLYVVAGRALAPRPEASGGPPVASAAAAGVLS
jgi:hypothetical protein